MSSDARLPGNLYFRGKIFEKPVQKNSFKNKYSANFLQQPPLGSDKTGVLGGGGSCCIDIEHMVNQHFGKWE